MEIPRYGSADEVVLVWQEYDTDRQGLVYCFEPRDKESGFYSSTAHDIGEMVAQLRPLGIHSDQIENWGLYDSPRKELPEMQFERLMRALSRPKIIVTMLPEIIGERARIEDGVNLNRGFSINYKNNIEIIDLEGVPILLNIYGAKANDLLFHELVHKKYREYTCLEDKYRYYISASLDRIK